MKQFLLAGAALVALSTASFAADMPMAAPVEAAAVESHDWAGFYVGVQGGYNWIDGDAENPFGAGEADFESDGFTIGLYSGYNRQWGNWVVGIDNSISYVDIDDAFGGVDYEANILSTTRGRLGYSFGNFMVFAAGGVALQHVEISAAGDDDDHLMAGYTVGGGVEAKLGGNWSARVEYLYSDFSEERFVTEDVAADISFDSSIVRGGVAYHF